MNIEKKNIFISPTASVKDALKALDKTAEKVLLVVDKDRKLLGTITDGDIRRYILKGERLDNRIGDVYNKNPLFVRQTQGKVQQVKKLLLENKIELLPVLDYDDRVVDYTTWSQVFTEETQMKSKAHAIDIPVVIMAGGRGARLEPFTRILPKPLVPVGEKPIIQIIMEEFDLHGISRFYVTLNYKGEMIRSYFDNEPHNYEIRYYKEEKCGGTAGSLKLMENDIDDNFFVTNCDVIVKFDLADVLNFHKTQNSTLTILASIQHHKIPYGVIEYRKGGVITRIDEKPEFTFTVNTGVYLLQKSALSQIPASMCYDMTDLISGLIESNKKVLMYPVNENDYIDIGQWEAYRRNIKQLTINEL
jgi:dTDP-glucose pyrophosphorylase